MPEQLIQGFVQGLAHLFTLSTLTLMVTGVIIGFVFGVVPGLSGYVALAVLLPFIYGMEPAHGLVFLLAAHSVNCTGGSISAILLGIPGTPVNAATLIDGFPMAQQGKAGQALGAALMSSMLGGIWGAVILALLIPVVIPFALAFRAPELFLLVMLSLSCVAGLSRGSLLKGLLSATIGFIISFIGFQGQTALTRFTFGWLYLYDGVRLIPLTLGLFAMPIIFDLAAKGTTITETADSRPVSGAEVAEGVKDVFRHFWLFMRASAIGAVIGILPGIGADAATFLAYGHARQTSRHMERFGHGTVEGVIAPEAANNAKEGGALLPTLTLGIPGSGAMAILMGAFWLVGLAPAKLFFKEI